MSKAPRVTANDVIRALRRLGFEKIGQRGSHQKWVHPVTGNKTIVPYHGSATIHPKTFATIVEGTGLSVDEFRKYL